jgi:hypothetical protein
MRERDRPATAVPWRSERADMAVTSRDVRVLTRLPLRMLALAGGDGEAYTRKEVLLGDGGTTVQSVLGTFPRALLNGCTCASACPLHTLPDERLPPGATQPKCRVQATMCSTTAAQMLVLRALELSSQWTKPERSFSTLRYTCRHNRNRHVCSGLAFRVHESRFSAGSGQCMF